MSDDWARRTAERIKQSEGERRRDAELQSERRSLLKAQAPHLWEHLAEQLKKKAEDVNALRPKGQPYFSVKSFPGDVPRVEIESPQGRLEVAHVDALDTITISRFTTPDPFEKPKKEIHESLHFEVVEGRVWVQTEEKVNYSAAAAAERILEILA